MKKEKRSILLVILVILLISLSACGAKKRTPAALESPTPLPPVVISTQKPNEMPTKVANTPSIVLLRNFDCTSVTDVPSAECQALVVFYNAANGDGWHEKSGWLESSTVGNWYGVTVNNNHVSALNLSKNQLSGFMPAEIGELKYLGYLGLNDNQLTGNIPMELGTLTSLYGLALSNNELSGEIPASLGKLTKLTGLYLSSNKLSGNVPPEVGDLVNLKTFNIHDNPLSGSLPVSLAHLTSLEVFSFFGTDLCEPATSDFQGWKSTVKQFNAPGQVCK